LNIKENFTGSNVKHEGTCGTTRGHGLIDI